MGIKPQPKSVPWRSEDYRKFIRQHDCCECNWPADLGEIEAHHILTGGMATKCDDRFLVPLCSFNARKCHRKADKLPESADKYLPIAERLYLEWLNK